MKRFFLLMAVLLLSSSEHFIATEASAQTYGKRIYSCAYDGFVNMREEPSFSAEKVGKFNNGPEGAVLLEYLGDWVKINASGIIGYVPTKYTQEAPTVAYTGDVSVDWIEGIWSQGGSLLMIYNNGTWEYGYDYQTSWGKYILQNNEIKFIPLEKEEGLGTVDEILPINREEDRLGELERVGFLTHEELEEMGESEDDYALGYGVLTKKDFRESGKSLLKALESRTQIPQYGNDLGDIAADDRGAQILNDSDDNEKTSFFESKFFSWLVIALLAVLGILLVLWLAKLIKKWYLKSKDKIAAKAQDAKEKAIELGGKAKEKAIEIGGKAKEKAIEYGEIAKEKASSVSEDAKAMLANASEKASKKKISIPTWLLIFGAYMALFWDYPLGLLIIVLALAYILAKKFVPSKTEQLMNAVKDKMRYFESRPVLKRGLIWLIVGIVVFRSFSGIIGAIIILASLITIILNKFSPRTAERIDAFINGKIGDRIKFLWNQRWFKIALIALLVILPLITIPPQNNALEFTPVGAELQEAKIEREIERVKDDDVEVGSFDYYRIQLMELQKEAVKAQSRQDWATYHECERAAERLKAEARLKYPGSIYFY